MADETINKDYDPTLGISPPPYPVPDASEPPSPGTPESRMDQAKAKAQEIASTASEKAGEATQRLGEQMGALADQVRTRAPHEGRLGGAATAVAGGLESAGEYLQQANFENMVEDLTTVVRRYPLQSLLIGIGIGYLLARSTER